MNHCLMHSRVSHPDSNQLSDQYNVSQLLAQFDMSQISAPSTIRNESPTNTAPCDSDTQCELSELLCDMSHFIVQ